jgi:hypothetical protein
VIMSVFLRFIATIVICSTGFATAGFGQGSMGEMRGKVDAVIAQAYESAAEQFPCRLRTRGKVNMVRRPDLDRCLNYAYDRVDWKTVSSRILEIREQYGFQEIDIVDLIETSLSSKTIPYDRVFDIREENAFLPLSNSLLKFLPDGSFDGMPVYSSEGELLGMFAGVYSYEKRGGLSSADSFQLIYFQYVDFDGKVHTPSERFLLDSYAVPWKEAMYKTGFRLPSNEIILAR